MEGDQNSPPSRVVERGGRDKRSSSNGATVSCLAARAPPGPKDNSEGQIRTLMNQVLNHYYAGIVYYCHKGTGRK